MIPTSNLSGKVTRTSDALGGSTGGTTATGGTTNQPPPTNTTTKPAPTGGTIDRYGVPRGGQLPQAQTSQQTQPLQQAQSGAQVLDPTAGMQQTQQPLAQTSMQTSNGLNLPGYDTNAGRTLWNFVPGVAGADVIARIANGEDPWTAWTGSVGDNLGGIAGAGADAAADIGGSVMEGAVPGLQDLLTQLVQGGASIWGAGEQAWNDAMGPPPDIYQRMQELVGQYGFQPSDLFQAAGQNMMTISDPAAWEQMAQNRMDAHREEARASMNDAERRMRGAAARSGFNPAGGVGNIYSDYAGSMQDAQRNIFNDALQNQMQAANMVNNFALGERGLDQQAWANQLGMLGGALNAQNAYDQHNYTNFGEAVGGVANMLGGLTGGATQGAGDLMGGVGSLLGPLLMLGGLPLGI